MAGQPDGLGSARSLVPLTSKSTSFGDIPAAISPTRPTGPMRRSTPPVIVVVWGLPHGRRTECGRGRAIRQHDAWVRGSAVLADLVRRLGRDVRLRYPDAEVVVTDEVVKLVVGDGWYGERVWVDEEDELRPKEAEEFIAETARSLVDNGWPDEETWPVCPAHSKSGWFEVRLVGCARRTAGPRRSRWAS